MTRRVLITDRDIEVMKWIGEQYAVRLDQIQILMARGQKYLSEQKQTKEKGRVILATAERRVKQWVREGLIEREKKFYKVPAWVWLTKQGLELVGQDYNYIKPKKLDHIWWVNQVRLYVEQRQKEKQQTTEWKGERQLRYEWGKSEGAKKRHIPDAEVVTPNGVVAVEVELTQKGKRRIRGIMRGLVRSYDTIWYFVNDTAHQFIINRKQELPELEARKFMVYHLDDMVS